MNKIPDELLMAYADGELSPADRRCLEAMAERNPAVRQRVQEWERSNLLLSRLYNRPMTEPVPDRLLETVMRAPLRQKPAPVAAKPTGAQWIAHQIRTLAVVWPSWRMSAALSCSILAGIGIGWGLPGDGWRPNPSSEVAVIKDGRLMAGSALANGLESTASGTRVALAGRSDVALKPLFSFESHAGGFCRQYELGLGAGAKFSGVGCRERDGQWRLEVHAPVASRMERDGKVIVAGNGTSPAVEGAVDRMISGELLDAETEGRVVSNAWRKLPKSP
jgi:hypothetical protein